MTSRDIRVYESRVFISISLSSRIFAPQWSKRSLLFFMASLAVARVYQQSFETHPNTTLAFTGAAFNALGDVVAQSYQSLVRNYLTLAPRLTICSLENATNSMDTTLQELCVSFALVLSSVRS